MKANKILFILLFLWGFVFSGKIFAALNFDCENPDEIYNPINEKHRGIEYNNDEFTKLLSKPDAADFQMTYTKLARIMYCCQASGEYIEALRSSSGGVSEYIKKFLAFYDSNRENIKKNLEKEDPKAEIITSFDFFKQQYEKK